VARATGIARNTIAVGLRELKSRGRPLRWEHERVRRPGGGRKRLTDHQPELISKLEALIEPTVRGDPQSASALGKMSPALLSKTRPYG